MLCCTVGNAQDRVQSKRIDEQIEEDKKKQKVRLLLLGAGESGKSTVAKQMKIIHLKGFNDEEKLGHKPAIFSNILGSIRALALATDKLRIPVGDAAQDAKRRILEDDLTNSSLTKSIAAEIKVLWNDAGIKQAYARSAEFQLNDSAEYYLNDIDRIAAEGYVPTVADILRSRVKTTGINEIEFSIGNTQFTMVDVGGQRSERRKWLNCFSDVTAVIFVVAMSAYDQKLYEDETTNRMHEELKLFKDICNSQWFSETAIILFLNKKDLFEKKIEKVPLSVCFPEYKGGNTYKEVSHYIEDKFLSQNDNPQKLIYVHHTCATDTDQITVVFKAVQDIILTKILKQTSTH